jgi:hypothetical protein
MDADKVDPEELRAMLGRVHQTTRSLQKQTPNRVPGFSLAYGHTFVFRSAASCRNEDGHARKSL